MVPFIYLDQLAISSLLYSVDRSGVDRYWLFNERKVKMGIPNSLFFTFLSLKIILIFSLLFSLLYACFASKLFSPPTLLPLILWFYNLTWHIYLLIESATLSCFKYRSVWQSTVLHPPSPPSLLRLLHLATSSLTLFPSSPSSFPSLCQSYLHGRWSEGGTLSAVQSDE